MILPIHWVHDLNYLPFTSATPKSSTSKGDSDAAREQLAKADVLFRDMEMTWWSEQAVGLRGRIDGGELFRGFAPYVDGPAGA